MDILAELEKLRQPHVYCEDFWYSCPKAEEGGDCNCGAEEHNIRLDNIINYLKDNYQINATGNNPGA